MQNKIIERLKKMLAMADTAAENPHEAANAARMAASLMEEHNITHAHIIATELNKGCGLAESITKKGFLKFPLYRQSIAINVAKLHDCFCNFQWSNGFKYIRFYGYKDDVEISVWLYDYIVVEIQRLFKSTRKRGDDSKYKADFNTGAATIIKERVAEIIADRKTRETSTGKGLVVLKSTKIIEVYGGPDYKYTRTTARPESDGVKAGYEAGYEAGKDIGFNKQID